MAVHQFETTSTGYTCSICLEHWQQEPATDSCRGYAIFRRWKDIPREQFATETQLKSDGKKPGGTWCAIIEYGSGRGYRCYRLYAVSDAITKEATPAQLAALEKANRAKRTCKKCGSLVAKPSYLSRRSRWCAECIDAQARQRRARHRDEMIVWARQLLNEHPDDIVILDVETSDLHAWCVEIAIIDLSGHLIFQSLINPLAPILASHIHGITDDMVQDAPTFAHIEPMLASTLTGKRVAAYNVSYDRDSLTREMERLHEPLLIPSGTADEAEWTAWRERMNQARAIALTWIEQATWIDVMRPYARAFSTWSNYHGDYRFLPLGGNHRAVGDALECLAALREIANARLSTEEQPLTHSRPLDENGQEPVSSEESAAALPAELVHPVRHDV